MTANDERRSCDTVEGRIPHEKLRSVLAVPTGKVQLANCTTRQYAEYYWSRRGVSRSSSLLLNSVMAVSRTLASAADDEKTMFTALVTANKSYYAVVTCEIKLFQNYFSLRRCPD